MQVMAEVRHHLRVLCIWGWPPQYVPWLYPQVHWRGDMWTDETAKADLTQHLICVQGTSLPLSGWPLLWLSFVFLCLTVSLYLPPSLPPSFYPENYISKEEWKDILCSGECKLCVCVSAEVIFSTLPPCSYRIDRSLEHHIYQSVHMSPTYHMNHSQSLPLQHK